MDTTKKDQITGTCCADIRKDDETTGSCNPPGMSGDAPYILPPSISCCGDDPSCSCTMPAPPADQVRNVPSSTSCCGDEVGKPGSSCTCTAHQAGAGRTDGDPSSASCCTDVFRRAAQPCSCTTPQGEKTPIFTTTGTLTWDNRLDHFLARWGVNRMGHRVSPGLCRLGNPDPDAPVLVSANYTLSFDALRSSLSGHGAYILVLDTYGINVWCAAGKGTFGTDELVRRIAVTGLASVVSHRTLIVPQLGAPGIAAHEVLRRSGFRVEYGPVRARDLPEYLKTGKATPGMRRVDFPFRDRVVLAPVELVHAALPALAAAAVLFFIAGPAAALAALAAVLAGTVLFPALLPFLPTKDFSTRGLILGALVALPFAVSFGSDTALPPWARVIAAAVPLLIIPAAVAYLALNFTGCTPFTSRTGVKKEIFRYVPVMTLLGGSGVALSILLGVSRLLGVI
jgi:hypothetical protein